MNFQELNHLHNLALKEAEKYSKKRFLYNEIYSKTGKHFTGIIGPRGVGKTVLLKQLAREYRNAFYISLDSVTELDLFETVKSLSENYGIKQFLLDEIHFYKEYHRVLKKIYDFLDVNIIFTNSASLAIYETGFDLSRRVNLIFMYPFSFREYLFFIEDSELPKLSLQLFVEYAATATSSWRFWKYHIDAPSVEKADKHWQMVRLADGVNVIPKARFLDAVFH